MVVNHQLIRQQRSKLAALLFAVVACLFLGVYPSGAAAQGNLPPGVTLEAFSAADQVVVGETFEYTVRLIGNMQHEQFQAPVFSRDGAFELISGPNISQQFEIRGGRSALTHTWTYLVRARVVGEHRVGPARVRLRNTWHDTREVPIKVIDGDGLGISARTSQQAINDQLRGKYFALAQTPGRIYEGQAVPVTVYMYRAEELPAFAQWDRPQDARGQDFIIPGQVDSRQALNWTRTEVAGQEFLRAPLYTTFVVPTRAGTLRLDPPVTRIYFALQSRSRSPMDDFFSMGPRSNLIAAECLIAPMELQVLPLPAKQSDSAAIVPGRIFVKADVDRNELPHRELVTLTIEVSGNSFLDIMARPELPNIPHFTVVNTTSDGNSWVENNHMLSRRRFNYVLQAMNPGESRIPAIKFEMMNPEDGQIEVVRTEEIQLRVRPSASGAVLVGGMESTPGAARDTAPQRAAGRVLGRDVAYIDTTPLTAAALAPTAAFYTRPLFWLLQIVVLITSLTYGFIQVRRRSGVQESQTTRNKRSRRAAEKALAEARAKLDAPSRDEFYAGVSAGIRGFVATLLGRSAKGMTTEEAAEGIRAMGVGEDTTAKLWALLSHCDGIRYSPAEDAPEARRQVLEKAESLLVNLDAEKRS